MMAQAMLKEEEVMTDYQFKALVKMILRFVDEAGDVEKIKDFLKSLLEKESG